MEIKLCKKGEMVRDVMSAIAVVVLSSIIFVYIYDQEGRVDEYMKIWWDGL